LAKLFVRVWMGGVLAPPLEFLHISGGLPEGEECH
jgi:hypothetical protein